MTARPADRLLGVYRTVWLPGQDRMRYLSPRIVTSLNYDSATEMSREDRPSGEKLP